jgi:AcrR family transcriptional regulator
VCYSCPVPIRVDHAERQTRLAAAVWRIVLRDGVRGASVRRVAREAGLSMGSVRYFFSTQDQLLQFAMREVIKRASARIDAGGEERAAALRDGRPVDAVLSVVAEVLPLDDERLTEARVWAAFAGQTADPGMAAIRREADDGVGQICHDGLTALAEGGRIDPSRDLEIETERLWSLLDGLTMHILLDPARMPADRVETLLRTHLGDLRTPRTGP